MGRSPFDDHTHIPRGPYSFNQTKGLDTEDDPGISILDMKVGRVVFSKIHPDDDSKKQLISGIYLHFLDSWEEDEQAGRRRA
ncbi:MAG: hypothetical protein SH809_16940 [Rhodothermales bacterium]|nr:hypothetical protein [Rhodothermales bacterium]